MSEQGHVLFRFINKQDGVDQTFGVNLKKYLGAKPSEITNVEKSGDGVDRTTLNDYEKLQL